MGNIIVYPPRQEQLKRDKMLKKMSQQGYRTVSEASGSFHRDRKYVFPEPRLDGSFSTAHEIQEETGVKMSPDPSFSLLDTTQFEMETLRLEPQTLSRESSFNKPPSSAYCSTARSVLTVQSGRTASSTGRYIKRYRSEEAKLVDILQEREALIRSAIKQGQQLRAKCNRYKEELDSLKAVSAVDMTDLEWRRRYDELDDKYRTLKEQLDVIAARNKNGREYLQQQEGTIALLQNELQREKVEKARLQSSSMGSLTSVGVKSGKGRRQIMQLKVDRQLLTERVQDLTTRNARGKEYLSKLEAEKREQEHLLARLKAELLKERQEKENFAVTVQTLRASQENLASHVDQPLYAQVNKGANRATSSSPQSERVQAASQEEQRSATLGSRAGSHDGLSTGFDTERGNVGGSDWGSSHPDAYETVQFHQPPADTSSEQSNESSSLADSVPVEPGPSPNSRHSTPRSSISMPREPETERAHVPVVEVQGDEVSDSDRGSLGRRSDTSSQLCIENGLAYPGPPSPKIQNEPIWDTVPQSNTIEYSATKL